MGFIQNLKNEQIKLIFLRASLTGVQINLVQQLCNIIDNMYQNSKKLKLITEKNNKP